MKPVASYVTRFFRWWGGSLMSCLPASTARYISDVHNRIDLIIAHQGESIFIQTSRGRILESIALTQEIGIDFSNLPDANTDVRLEATGASFDADRFELTRDPEMSRRKGQFVAALKEDIQQIDIDLLDLAISREDRPVDDATCDIDLSAPMDNTNVIPIDVHRDDNTVRLVEDDDETAHLLDPEQQVEDDTFIIQRDQGKLLQFGTTVAKA